MLAFQHAKLIAVAYFSSRALAFLVSFHDGLVEGLDLKHVLHFTVHALPLT